MVEVVVALTGICALTSALWPVEYAAAGIVTPHLVDLPGRELAGDLWDRVAHPSYALLQVLWLVAVVMRWRSSDLVVRRQLFVLALPVALSAVALLAGLAVAGSPRAGLLAACLVPVGAGWAVVHGQHLATYGALSWLSRVGPTSADLPTDLARAARDAVGATRSRLWVGDRDRLDVIGVWPPTEEDLPPQGIAALQTDARTRVRAVLRGDQIIGALGVDLDDGSRLSLAEERLLDHLVG